MKFSIFVCIALFLGILTGHFYQINTGYIYEIVILLLIFIIGIEVGQSFNLNELKKIGIIGIVLPCLTFIGSFLGGLVCAYFLNIGLKWGGAIAAGCGWYSLTGPIIAKKSAFFGIIGFLANFIRELIVILIYPFIIKKLRREIVISIGGATTMDTTLPLIAKFGDYEMVLIALIHGVIITLLIPILLPIILSF